MDRGTSRHGLKRSSILASALLAAQFLGAQGPSPDEALKKLSSAEPHFARGLKAFQAGRLEDAEAALGECVGIMPGHAFAHYYLANLAYVRGDQARALGCMEKALESFDPMQELGDHAARLKLKRIDSYGLMLAKEWDNGPNCRQSRELEAIEDHLTDAKSKLELAARKAAEARTAQKAHYLYFCGNVLFRLERFEEALRKYEEAIGLNPRHADAYNNAAAVRYLAGDHPRALALLEQAAARGLEDNINLKLSHLVNEALGRPTEGILSEDLSGPESGGLGVVRFALAYKAPQALMPPLYENAYVVYSRATRQALLVDPGVEDPRIEAFVRENGLEVRAILNTHGHPDHASADAHYARLFGAPVCASKADAAAYEVRAGRHLAEGDAVELDGLTVRVLHTPGHTPGSLCFVVGSYLFSGDTLFRGDIGKVGEEGPGKAPKARAELVRTIERKLLTLPGPTRVCPGHGKVSTIAEEAAGNPFLKK